MCWFRQAPPSASRTLKVSEWMRKYYKGKVKLVLMKDKHERAVSERT